MHEVGTVVFTVSAQFGVPVTSIWALTRGITSYAREIVTSIVGVEYRPAAFLAQPALVASRSGREQGAKSPLWVISGQAEFGTVSLLFGPNRTHTVYLKAASSNHATRSTDCGAIKPILPHGTALVPAPWAKLGEAGVLGAVATVRNQRVRSRQDTTIPGGKSITEN